MKDVYKNIIDEYLINGCNKAQAYKKYRDSKGTMSTETATTSFNRIFKLPEVQKYYRDEQEKLSLKYDLSKEKVLRFLHRVIHSDPIEFIEMVEVKEVVKGEVITYQDFKIKAFPEIPKEVREMISVKGNHKGVTLNFFCKMKALDLVCKILGYYNNSVAPVGNARQGSDSKGLKLTRIEFNPNFRAMTEGEKALINTNNV